MLFFHHVLKRCLQHLETVPVGSVEVTVCAMRVDRRVGQVRWVGRAGAEVLPGVCVGGTSGFEAG